MFKSTFVRLIGTLFALAGIVFLISCASVTLYRPSSGGRGGYADYRIDKNTALVTFKGDRRTSLETVKIYLLYRCAEVTLMYNYDCFCMNNIEKDQKTTYHLELQYGYWVKVPVTKNTLIAEIKMFSGDTPENQKDVYNAKDIVEYLRPQIKR